jgi:predicted MFS family arabinose efflux permease
VPFAGFAVVAVVLAFIAARWLPRMAGPAGGPGVRMRDVLRQPALAAVITATALIMLGQFSFSTYVAPYLTHAGLTETQIAPALLASGAAGVVGLGLAGLLIDRTLRASLLAATGLLTVTFIVLAIGGTATAVAVAGNAALGLAMGMLPVFLQAAAMRAAPNAHDPASALNAAAFNVGIAGGALLGGVSLDVLGPAALPLVAATLAAVGLTAMAASRHVGRAQNTVLHPSPAPAQNTV